jgi:hypothetical protein
MTEDDKKLMRDQRFELATDTINHARICIKDHRGDLALKALDIAELQIAKLKDLI